MGFEWHILGGCDGCDCMSVNMFGDSGVAGDMNGG